MKKSPMQFFFSAAMMLALVSCGSNAEPQKSSTLSSEIPASSSMPTVSSSQETPVSSSQEAPTSSSEHSSTPASGGIYVSATPKSGANGTREKPYSFFEGIKASKPGNTVYLLGGTYKSSETLFVTNVKSHASYNDTYTVTSEEGRRIITPAITNGAEDKVVFDFSAMPFNSSNRGITLNSDYWTLRNVEVFGAGDNGVYIGGNHNIVENLDIHDCQDTGLQLGRKSSSDKTIDSWPSYNLILNCTSHDNHDITGEDSDGFACKLTTGVGNVFDGCIAYNNVDDGWDLYTKGDSGPIGPVTIKNCIAFNNGITSYGVGTANSDGNGFKLGGEAIAVSHTVLNSIAFNNMATGFTDNSNPGTIRIENCTSFNNGTRDLDANNFDMCRDTKTSVNYYKNLLSYCEGDRVSPITGTVAKANSRDQYKGTVSYSVFYSGLSMLRFGNLQECDYSVKAKAGSVYKEPNGKAPFVSMATPQPQSSKGVEASVHADIHHLLRDENGDIKLGDFLRVDPTSSFATLGEGGKPLGANLVGGYKA